MNTTFVVVKSADKDNQTTFELVDHLLPGQTISSAVATTLSPTSSPPLTSNVLPSGTQVAIQFIGGVSGITYNVRLQVTTANPVETKTFTAAVSVQDSQYVTFQTKNPMAFQRLVDQIDVGETAVGSGTFMFKPGTNLSAATVRWSLLDNEGVLYSKGNAYDYKIVNTSLAIRLEAYGLINVPSNVDPSTSEHTYMIQWELTGLTNEPIKAFEGVKVLGPTTTPQGTGDVIEMRGDPAMVSLILPELFENVALEVYRRDVKLAGPVPVPLLERTNDGHMYAANISTSGLPADIEAYNAIWSYRNSATSGSIAVQREIGEVFIVSPNILSAVNDIRKMVMKSHTTLLQMPDMLFTTATILGWLRRGRDFFNAAGGFHTSFTMSAATGSIREFWLGFTEVAILTAQALAEAEKAFDFQGQAISLTRDVSQAYQQAAETLYQRLEPQVRLYKQNLARKGVQGGTGDVENLRGAMPTAVVGISITPITRYPRFQGRNVLNR